MNTYNSKVVKHMKNLIIYIHGKGGSANEVEHYRSLFPNSEVLGFDYRSQTPWEAKEEFPAYFAEKRKQCKHLTLIANSIGAFFSLSSLDKALVDKAYFVSPVVDMEKLICSMMQWSNVTERELAEKSEIATDFGETLSWRYLCYVREHQVLWNVPTCILYGEYDNLTSIETISTFAKQHNANLTVMPDGEHWFHTEEQIRFLDDWIKKAENQTSVVRYATRDELPRVNELRKMVSELHADKRSDIFRPDFCDELRQRVYTLFDAPEYDVIVACLGETICGFAIVQYIDKPESAYMCAQRFYHIEEFGVDERYRRCGIGTALLNFCKTEAKSRDFDRLTLDVWTFNETAQKFYEAAGFRSYRSYLEINT